MLAANFEAQDKKLRKKIILWKVMEPVSLAFLIGIIIVLGILYQNGIRIYFDDGIIAVVLISLIFGALFLSAISWKKMNNYIQIRERKIRANIIQSLELTEFENFQHEEKEGFEIEYLDNLGVFMALKGFLSAIEKIRDRNNLIQSKYKGLKFRQSYIRELSGGSLTIRKKIPHPLRLPAPFAGSWLVYQFDKEFPLYLQLRENRKKVTIDDKTKEKQSMKATVNIPETIRLSFDAFTDDEKLVKDFLNPYLVQAIEKMSKRLEKNNFIYILFIRNELHVGCEKPYTKTGIKSLDWWKDDVRDDIQAIKDILDILQLDKIDNSGEYLSFNHLEKERE